MNYNKNNDNNYNILFNVSTFGIKFLGLQKLRNEISICLLTMIFSPSIAYSLGNLPSFFPSEVDMANLPVNIIVAFSTIKHGIFSSG